MTGRGRASLERGAASLLVVACTGLLLFLGGALGVVAALVTAHRAAQSAADLAALAGASTHQDGGDACAAASSLASGNEALLVGCRLEGDDVLVTVEVAGPRWLGQRGDLVAEARAGPG